MKLPGFLRRDKRMSMKRAWDPAVLTVLWWSGQDPNVGDVLETSTGRRYLITRFRLSRPVNGKTKVRAFETVVLPKDEPLDRGAKVHRWEWGKRTRRRPVALLGSGAGRAGA